MRIAYRNKVRLYNFVPWIVLALAVGSCVLGCSFNVHLGGKYYNDRPDEASVIFEFPEQPQGDDDDDGAIAPASKRSVKLKAKYARK